MRFMNDYDITSAISRHSRNSHPNRLGAALVIDQLAEWTNAHSDGWAYWPKPARAAAHLMEIAENWQASEDCTDEQFAAAVRPVKSFLTKHRAMVTSDERERILRGAQPVSA